MKIFKSIYLYLVFYLAIIFILSLLLSNTDFLMLTGICSILLILTVITDVTQKRTYKKIIDKYNQLLEQKQYDKIIEILNRYIRKYYVKVLVTNLYLYKGDEKNYLNLYDKYKKYGITRGYFYRLLHYTNGYYKFLSSDIDFYLSEDSQFPLNKIINLYKDNKLGEVKALIELLPQIKSDLINYITKYIYIMCLTKEGNNYLMLNTFLCNYLFKSPFFL